MKAKVRLLLNALGKYYFIHFTLSFLITVVLVVTSFIFFLSAKTVLFEYPVPKIIGTIFFFAFSASSIYALFKSLTLFKNEKRYLQHLFLFLLGIIKVFLLFALIHFNLVNFHSTISQSKRLSNEEKELKIREYENFFRTSPSAVARTLGIFIVESGIAYYLVNKRSLRNKVSSHKVEKVVLR